RRHRRRRAPDPTPAPRRRRARSVAGQHHDAVHGDGPPEPPPVHRAEQAPRRRDRPRGRPQPPGGRGAPRTGPRARPLSRRGQQLLTPNVGRRSHGTRKAGAMVSEATDPPAVYVARSPADVLRLVVALSCLVALLLVEWLFGDTLVGFASDLFRGLGA